jgi:hypothetical protein
MVPKGDSMAAFDRRRYPRTHVRARAIVTAGGQSSPFMTENLSAGGARIVGDLALSAGDPIDVMMELDDASIRVAATVVRVGFEVEDVAIEFRDPSAETQDRIQQFVLAALARQRAAHANGILVLGSSERIRVALERDLAELGRETVLAATPLDALWTLQGRTRAFDTVIVELASGRELEVLDYLIDEHPQVWRIGLGESAGMLQEALAAGRVQAVLDLPWHPRGLRVALRSE